MTLANKGVIFLCTFAAAIQHARSEIVRTANSRAAVL